MDSTPQPDKRSAAFETIFGRPKHAVAPSYDPTQYYQQPIHPQQSPQLMNQTRVSYPPSLPPGAAYVQSPQQQVYTLQPAQPFRATYYPQQQQAYYHPHLIPQFPNVPSPHRTPSPYAAGPSSSQPQDTRIQGQDPHPIPPNMTPAQVYQAQVFLNSPQSVPLSQPYPAPPGAGPPQLPGVSVGNGGLGLSDFRSNVDGDDGESDLPWAQQDAQPSPSNHPQFLSNGRHHHRSPSSGGGPPSPASTIEPSSPTMSTSRRSIDSVRTMPHMPQTSGHRTPGHSHSQSIGHTGSVGRRAGAGAGGAMNQDRIRSMSASASASASNPKASSIVDFRGMSPMSRIVDVPSPSATPTRNPNRLSRQHTPMVYPALLSRVAEAFRMRIALTERVKDGLTYKDVFDGREAVDKIAYIIKTTDRNLALLLGRALDAQKFFHDVTYDHRLRDSPHEIYQFKSRLPSPFTSEDLVTPSSVGTPSNGNTSAISPTSTVSNPFSQSSLALESEVGTPVTSMSSTSLATNGKRPRAESVSSTDDAPLPSGVFTLLTDCYSPTCTPQQLCYSIACPRRLEQQARLNMKPEPGLRPSISEESMNDFPHREAGTLWIHSVPQEVVDSVSDLEKKRQEAINEAIYTERDFIKDLEYLRDAWIRPLRNSDIIPDSRRLQFVQQVFWNLEEIISVNIRLRDMLNKRQKGYAIVETIGDIFLDVVRDFEPFVRYGSHQLYGKFEFEKEKASNPAFAQFVEETERLPESRKLELNGYLTKPTTRLARYPLLLGVILKHTAEDNPDRVNIPKVVTIIKDFLTRVNEESGKADNRFSLLQLDQQLVFKYVEPVDLRLRDDNRELLYKGQLKRRGGTHGENVDLQVFLFDHALLMVKAKTKHEQFRVYKRPIPLELLVVSPHEDAPSSTRTGSSKPRQTIMRRSSFSREKDAPASRTNSILPLPMKQDSKNGYAITFMHLGRKGYVITLWASTIIGRRKWLEAIAKQQEVLRERSLTFDTVTLSEGFFFSANKVNCAAPFMNGTQIAYGTDNGVYFGDLKERGREPIHVLALPDVTQVDVLQEYDLLVVLSERIVMTIPLDALDPSDPTACLKRAKKVSSHTSFFKAGVCLGRTLLCVVKASALSSTIKTLEPIDQKILAKSKPTFRKLLQGGNDTLRVFKEFYIPTESSSIHFLKTKLCVGCTKGFEIVDLESLDTQGLLNPGDDSLDFVQKKTNTRPVAIYRIENEFLLCYDEFAFYVNKDGCRAHPQWIVHWEGSPTSFALSYPFVLAFEPTFVEVRHVDTAQLIQIIPGNNLRCLFADTPPSITHSAAHFNSWFQDAYPSFYRNPNLPPPRPYSGWPPSQHQGYNRDEIIIVSEDRVMMIRLVPPPAIRQQMALQAGMSGTLSADGTTLEGPESPTLSGTTLT